MATILARKFFSRRGTITGGTAVSYLSLMRSFPAVTGTPAWGTNTDGSPSMDSTWGDGATIIPVTSTLYVGYDAQVADADSAATYTGVPAVAGEPFALQDYFPGPVDVAQVWIYSASTQSVDLIFQGRQ